MFEKVIEFTFFWLPIAFVIGYFLDLVYNQTRGRYRTAFNILAFIGVVIHEAAHIMLCFITGVPVKRIEVNYRDKATGRAFPHGAVKLKRKREISFIQSFLFGIAPLLVGVIIFFLLLDVACDLSVEPLYRIVAGITCFSILLGVRPSTTDLKLIIKDFQNNPSKSLFQIILLCLSFGLVWLIVDLFTLNFPFEFLYYIFMGIIFIALKYLCVASYIIYKRCGKSRTDKNIEGLYSEFLEADNHDRAPIFR